MLKAFFVVLTKYCGKFIVIQWSLKCVQNLHIYDDL